MYFIMLTQVRLLCVDAAQQHVEVLVREHDIRRLSDGLGAGAGADGDFAGVHGRRSLTPSPMYPTQCPSRRSSETIRALCSGVSLANTFTRRSSVPSAVSVMSSSVRPVTTVEH